MQIYGSMDINAKTVIITEESSSCTLRCHPSHKPNGIFPIHETASDTDKWATCVDHVQTWLSRHCPEYKYKKRILCLCYTLRVAARCSNPSPILFQKITVRDQWQAGKQCTYPINCKQGLCWWLSKADNCQLSIVWPMLLLTSPLRYVALDCQTTRWKIKFVDCLARPLLVLFTKVFDPQWARKFAPPYYADVFALNRNRY